MIYVFDIDDTICTKDSLEDYEDCRPIRKRIEKINNLYENGNIIILNTARGMGRFNNDCNLAESTFRELTEKQLALWNVKYHKLFMGKPSGDIYIDDKGISDIDFFKE